MKSRPLSIFIICKNEESIIGQCLEQAAKLREKLGALTDERSGESEIVVVDSGSTDDTLNIAKGYADRLEHHDWQGYAQQKNFALSLCRNEWVLSLDADEVLTDELIEEILGLCLAMSLAEVGIIGAAPEKLNSSVQGYKIARKLYIGEKFVRWGGYFPDYQLRLFKKSEARFAQAKVHESIEVLDHETGKYSKKLDSIKHLEEPLDHYSYDSLDELKAAFDKYARLANEDIAANKKSFLKAGVKFLYTFLYKYFIRLGFMHGLLGLKLALIHAKYSFKKWK